MDPLPGNLDVIRIFKVVRDQITVNGAPDINAINTAMDLYGVENRRYVFEKVLDCFGIMANIEKKKSKGNK